MFDNPTIEALALATVESILEKRGDDQIARLLADLEQMPDEAAHSLTRLSPPGELALKPNPDRTKFSFIAPKYRRSLPR